MSGVLRAGVCGGPDDLAPDGLAGLASAGLLVAILPANVQMAADLMRSRKSTPVKIASLVRLPHAVADDPHGLAGLPIPAVTELSRVGVGEPGRACRGRRRLRVGRVTVSPSSTTRSGTSASTSRMVSGVVQTGLVLRA